MIIFFGACSGVVLGNDTVRTPFSNPALMSSLYIIDTLASALLSGKMSSELTLIP